ncbi:hypothetical protein PGTUg99_000456 [Puccinia graminis f. sp. tritici]|uniref:Uncharacterized protein n=1 Tax=Puccinia graminis f. sp. tritici TaxID=56615 RepID=A0A5B0RZZ3_PUCGR|nr:hypothetical protein PGTUg99_029312 [Puccinia graminis f. sp. tritici]KAA1131072.1 hypothetical protein PGTUg99_030557 [Puccinia graminis f. sp. tritici]KAA1132159.1 hypothetical protein PGTUg99_000456 [Puccinia graminis f. sp. tritici]
MNQSNQATQQVALRNKQREIQKYWFVLFIVALASLCRWARAIHSEPYNNTIFGGDAYVKQILSSNQHWAQAMLQMSIEMFSTSAPKSCMQSTLNWPPNSCLWTNNWQSSST